MDGLGSSIDQFLRHRFVMSECRRNSPIEKGEAFWAFGGNHWHELRGSYVEPRFEIPQHFRLEPFFQLFFIFAEAVSLAHGQRVELFEGKLEIMGYKFNCPKLGVVAFFARRS